ncbi:MAG: NrfD/PsrC family molybdoenzyme membrane anchor subunit [Egibacteraceae bacterium]
MSMESRTYYGRPVIEQPVWKPEIPWYFFAGGMAGAAATLAAVARAKGNERLADAAGRVALAGVLVSPPLLICDLGRPDRFHHMLRVFKPTSPMSVGSWVLAVFVPTAGGAAVLSALGWLPRLARAAEAVGAALGPVMSTYTAVLIANTAVPAWHEARKELPWVFAGGSAASAGAATLLLVSGEEAAPARRLAMLGAVCELVAAELMERRLGELGEPYQIGTAGTLSKLARCLSGAGAGLLGLLGRRRGAVVTGAALILAGAAAERWAVFKAGFASACDPKYTVKPQRERIDGRLVSDE